MRLKSTRPARRLDDDGVLPLINLVFLLLVFFMIAGQLKQTSPFEITLPVAKSNSTQSDTPLHIHLSASGQLAINNEIVSEEHLSVQLHQLQLPLSTAGVILQADSRVAARRVQDVLAILEQAGLQQVHLEVQATDGK